MKKFTINYALFCDHQIQDIRGKNSFIGVFDNFNVVTTFPAALVTFYVVGNVFIDDEEVRGVKINLEVKNTKDMKIASDMPAITIDHIPPSMNHQKRNFYFVFRLNGFVFDEPGKYKFNIFVNDEHIKELVLDVKSVN